jgi:AAA domain
MRLPPDDGLDSLEALDKADLGEPVERVHRIMHEHHNVVVEARYKVGKAALMLGLGRSLLTGDFFLDWFPVAPLKRGEAFAHWNAELSEVDFKAYAARFRPKDKADRERFKLAHLRGYRVNLLAEGGRKWAIDWLRTRNVKTWALDPWWRFCRWAGVSQNKGDEVGDLLQAVDEIKLEAGVREVVITHHMGHFADRARGASEQLDWPDMI